MRVGPSLARDRGPPLPFQSGRSVATSGQSKQTLLFFCELLHTSALKNIALTCLFFFYVGNAAAELVYSEIRSTGYGVNVAEAVVDALETAVSQVNGQRFSASTSLRVSASQQDGTDKLDESFERNVQKATRGVVKSYAIRESGFEPDGRAFAKVEAVIPSYTASEQLKRLRLVVAPLVLSPTLKENPGARKFSAAVSSSLEAYLTQSRKFAVLDRRFEEATATEIQAAADGRSAIEESVRVASRATADYLIVVSLSEFSYEVTSRRHISGRTIATARAPLSLDVRVIDIASGQVKFADSYQNLGFIPAGLNLERLALDVAGDVGEKINFAIYPIVVLARLGASEITLNQGGQTVQIGRTYRLIQLGSNLIDNYTREYLGPQEQDVGRVEIVSTTDRTAVARLVSGVLPTRFGPNSLIIRPLPDDVENGAISDLLTDSTEPDSRPPKKSLTGGSRRSSDDW